MSFKWCVSRLTFSYFYLIDCFHDAFYLQRHKEPMETPFQIKVSEHFSNEAENYRYVFDTSTQMKNLHQSLFDRRLRLSKLDLHNIIPLWSNGLINLSANIGYVFEMVCPSSHTPFFLSHWLLSWWFVFTKTRRSNGNSIPNQCERSPLHGKRELVDNFLYCATERYILTKESRKRVYLDI